MGKFISTVIQKQLWGAMKIKRVAVLVVMGLGLVLAGCIVPSVYPFYTDKDVLMDPALLGLWSAVDANDKEHWTFEKAGEQRYKVTIVDNDTNIYSAHLFKLKDRQFMDAMLLPDRGAGIPSHYLLKVAQIEPTLKMATLNYKWLDSYLDEHPDAIRHIIVLDDPADTNTAHIVLTADTKALQKFIVSQMNNTNAFEPMTEMKRQ
jgi:hypothetical protein